MSTITFTQASWAAFKDTLTATYDTGAIGTGSSLMSALHKLESTAHYATEAATPLGNTKGSRDASTQLYTPRGYYLSTHVFKEVRLRLCAQKLARHVAVLSCRLLAAYDTVWSLLAYCVTGSTDCLAHLTRVKSPRHPHAQEVPRASSAASFPQSPVTSVSDGVTAPSIASRLSMPSSSPMAQRIEDLMGVLDAHTLATLCAHQVAWRRRPPDTTADPRLFVKHTLATWAARAPSQLDETRTAASASLASGAPFLCRRCRQDQRGDYAYDEMHGRLVAVGPRPPPSRRAPPKASVSRQHPNPKAAVVRAPPRNTFQSTMLLTQTGLGTRPIQSRDTPEVSGFSLSKQQEGLCTPSRQAPRLPEL